MDNETLMTTWCRMWDTDPALAHQVMADDCRQWSAQLPGLDAVVGPDQQEQFVTAYRRRQVNLFRPRLLVDGGNRFGYLWDVTAPDGAVRTGADVNVLRAGRVVENWTSVGDRMGPPPLDTGHLETADPAATERACHRWAGLWDAQTRLPTDLPDLVTDDVVVFVGAADASAGEIRGRAALVDQLAHHREAGSRSELHARPVVDAAGGGAVLLRAQTRAGADQPGSGVIDVLQFRGARIARSWSLPGTRPFRY